MADPDRTDGQRQAHVPLANDHNQRHERHPLALTTRPAQLPGRTNEHPAYPHVGRGSEIDAPATALAPYEEKNVREQEVDAPGSPSTPSRRRSRHPRALHQALRLVRLADRCLFPVVVAAARAVARDATTEICRGKLLILAPHPDDETLACGGVIQATIASGGEVVIAVATDGRYGDTQVSPERMAAIRCRELAEATATLGVPAENVMSLGFADGSLDSAQMRLLDALRTLVDERQPDLIIGPLHWDMHPDHAALGRALCDLDHPVQRFAYLVWGWERPSTVVLQRMIRALREAPATRSRWPVKANASQYLAGKAAALACHGSQFAHDSSFAGQSIGTGGPIGNDFLRTFDGRWEIFFPLMRK